MFDSMFAFNRILQIDNIINDAYAFCDGNMNQLPVGFKDLEEDYMKVIRAKRRIFDRYYRAWKHACEAERRDLVALEEEEIEQTDYDLGLVVAEVELRVDQLKDERLQLISSLRLHNYQLYSRL